MAHPEQREGVAPTRALEIDQVRVMEAITGGRRKTAHRDAGRGRSVLPMERLPGPFPKEAPKDDDDVWQNPVPRHDLELGVPGRSVPDVSLRRDLVGPLADRFGQVGLDRVRMEDARLATEGEPGEEPGIGYEAARDRAAAQCISRRRSASERRRSTRPRRTRLSTMPVMVAEHWSTISASAPMGQGLPEASSTFRVTNWGMVRPSSPKS